jgi:anti-sigma factor RsiW
MEMTENDLERLEAYLDDALKPAEVESLRARLAADPRLVSALDQLRAERSMRQAYFAAIEPTEHEIDNLSARIHASLLRRRRFTALLRSAAAVAAAAACFLAGILVHATLFKPQSQQGPTATPISNPAVRSVEMYEVTLRDDSGKPVAVQRFDTLEKAQDFANDLHQWQRRASRLTSSQFIRRADRL